MNKQPRKLPSTENDVKKLVADWITARGGWSFAAPPARGMGVHGVADRLGVIPVQITPEMVGKHIGLFVAIEAKKPGRRGEKNAGATQAQVDFLQDAIHHEGLGALVDCHLDLEALSEILAAFIAEPQGENPSVALRNRLAHRISGNG